LLAVVLHGAGQWWPAFLLAAGLAILLRSVKPGPHIAVSVGLMGAGCLAFAITHGIIAKRAWTFVAACGLMLAGIILARLTANIRPANSSGRTERILILFRAAEITPESSKLERIRVFLLCGHLELNLKKAMPSSQLRDEPLMVEITAWAGNVKLLIWEGVGKLNHKAFALKLGQPTQTGVLDEERIGAARVVATSLVFFGDVEFEEAPIGDDSDAPGNLAGPDNRRPARR
jgi:hypothetical protein